jgi:hypothetical protein
MITMRQYRAGEVIFHENDEGDVAYIIDQGRVEVTKKLEGQEIHLATLNAGEIFGEMSLIEERPRSATVTAATDTTVRVVPREEFFQSLQKDPDAALSLLKVLFERLREGNATILQLQKDYPLTCHVPQGSLASEKGRFSMTVILEGTTPKAAQSLPSNPFHITKFPCRIGRQSHDPLVNNDLKISDFEPFQISRHHISFIQQENQIGVVDRGSHLGSLLNGVQLGGLHGNLKTHFLTEPESILVLGHLHSRFKFKITLQP